MIVSCESLSPAGEAKAVHSNSNTLSEPLALHYMSSEASPVDAPSEPALWVQYGSLLQHVPISNHLDIGRWRSAVKEAFSQNAALQSVSAKRLELRTLDAKTLSCGQKLAKIQAQGHGLEPQKALQLTVTEKKETAHDNPFEMEDVLELFG